MRPHQAFHTTAVASLISKQPYSIVLPAINNVVEGPCVYIILSISNYWWCKYQERMLLKATTVACAKEPLLCMYPGVHCAYILQVNDQPLAAWRHPIHVQTLVTRTTLFE